MKLAIATLMALLCLRRYCQAMPVPEPIPGHYSPYDHGYGGHGEYGKGGAEFGKGEAEYGKGEAEYGKGEAEYGKGEAEYGKGEAEYGVRGGTKNTNDQGIGLNTNIQNNINNQMNDYVNAKSSGYNRNNNGLQQRTTVGNDAGYRDLADQIFSG